MRKKWLVSVMGLLLLLLLLSACSLFRTGTSTNDGESTTAQEDTELEEPDLDESDELESESNDESPEIASQYNLADFFPDTTDNLYIYEGEGIEFASYTQFTDYADGNRKQIRENNGGTETVKVLELRDEEIAVLFSLPEIYYRENLLEESGAVSEVLIKAPLQVGNRWELEDGSERSITDADIAVETPAGTFEAIEITTMYEDGESRDYYAPDVGLIQSVYVSEGIETSSILSEIQEGVPFTQTVRFYFPGPDLDGLVFSDKELSFDTNEWTRSVIEMAYKERPSQDSGIVLTENAKINSLFLHQDGRVYIDLSAAFITEMNAGSSIESMILQSLANTMGGYYGVSEVYLTVENEPYESGHILMEEGEGLEVDTSESQEFEQ